MDVDAARQNRTAPSSACRRCGKVGHWARNCPDGLDVRALTFEEQEELIMELLAARDAAGMVSPEAESVETESKEELEDFQSHDG
ncbi:hypothetical protein C0991_012557 [Blastosporella zonata]|nr:hypothetical protein C0991_004336 [Blastosporella zonata]KAG6859813.1 hypothetical protein C0991_012557 [Blastosporella zonata]